MPKISVIIPVYKVEKYLPECLASVDRQTFRDFELILVDDGSPDRCGRMCDEYAASHPNTRVLHQQNMGLSEARNQGVLLAKGEYVAFIDSDDYVSEDYLEYLLYLVEKYGTEVSVARKTVFWDGSEPTVRKQTDADGVVTASEALIKICYNQLDICAWGKLYKRRLVEKYPYPKGQLYEDTATTYKIVGDTDRMAYGSRVIYYWRQRRGSITHAVITEKHLFGIVASKEQIAYMQKNYPDAVPAARARCAMKIVDLAYRAAMGKYDARLFRQIRDEIKPILKPLLSDPQTGWSLKVRSLALRFGYLPFKILSMVYSAIK